LRITILVDNKRSWIVPYALNLVTELRNRGNDVVLVHQPEEVRKGDVLCLLACEKVFKNLELNKFNLVVHESDLPKGKGWSPLTWQILEGKNRIPVTLFEAKEKIDSGEIYGKEYIELDGTELLQEIKHKQGIITQELILTFIDDLPNIEGVQQYGEESFYPRRGPGDSELDVNKSLKDQFNLLRVCDNERYPAFFMMNGKKYIVKIFKDD